MFRRSSEYTEPDIFTGTSQLLNSRKLKFYESDLQWHNVFYKEITSSINEEVFKVLYPSKTGRPNSPIRILVAMQILKEGFNWSDEQLFHESRFNLLVMRALGLTNINDEIPVPSTYYDFRAKLTAHQQQTGEDLFTQSFYNLTRLQAKTYNVNGSKIRMDSKLISSNIASCTRLQLTIGMLQKFFKTLDKRQKEKILKKHLIKLEELMEKDAQAHVFPLSNKEKTLWLKNLGKVYRYLLQKFSDDDSSEYNNLSRLYKEQYRESDDKQEVTLTPSQEISGNTMQSPHDPEATYRRKDNGQKKQRIKGYVANITETCDDQPLNLISDIITKTVVTPDDYFFQPALQNSEQVTGQITEVWTDGAYNSIDNYNFTQLPNSPIKWHLNALQGEKGFYEFWWKKEHLMVKDLRTGQTQKAIKTPKGKYRIDDTPGNKSRYRYFNSTTIENYFRRLEIEAQPADVKNKRANVESTVHHAFYHLKGSKTKYRGLIKNHIFNISRAMWVNFKRIQAFLSNYRPKKLISEMLLEIQNLRMKKMTKFSMQLLNFGLLMHLSKNRRMQFAKFVA